MTGEFAHRIRGWIVRGGAALVAVFILLACAPDAEAQIARAFSSRFTTNANGDIKLIGNTSMKCDPAGTNGAACPGALNGVGVGVALNNNNYSMINETAADATKTNASQATLSLPPGSTVLFAGLYWGAQSPSAQRGQVLLRTPATSGYAVINASVVDTSPAGGANNYGAFANVTAQVVAAGSGAYTVANVQTTLAAGQFGGWSLVVVYSNIADSLKNLTVYDGWAFVTSAATPVTVVPSGFLTPLSGPVNVRMGIVTYDGDLGTTGDTLSVNGVALSDAANPAGNYFNSSIADLGSLTAISRVPMYSNSLGVDVDRLNAPAGSIPNGATSATFVMSTAGAGAEVYYPQVISTAIDLYVPIITPNVVKTVSDLNGGNLVPGDALRWTISMSNTGVDTGTNLVLKDPIPANTAYVPGSLVVLTGANAGAKSDTNTGPTDDQAEYSTSAPACAPVTAPCVIFRLGTGANSTAGGNLAFGQSTSLRFDTTLNLGVPSGTSITNTAAISYSGQTLGAQFTTSSAAVSLSVLAPPTIAKSFNPDPIAVNGTSVLSIVVTNPAGAPATMTGVAFNDAYPAGVVNTGLPNAAVTCTPGSTAGTITGGAPGGNSIGMNPGTTLLPGGSCTVSVNVTSAASSNYVNTTSAVTSTNAGTGGTATATLSVGKPGITKAFSPATVLSGATSTLTFILNNPTAAALTSVAFTDSLVNMVVATPPAIVGNCGGGTVNATAGASSISLTGGALPAAVGVTPGTCTFSVNVTSATIGAQTNTTSGVTATQTGTAGIPSNTATLTVIGAPVASKSFSPTSVQSTTANAAAYSTLTLTLSNPNAALTITGAALTDTYPAGLVNFTAPSATLNCTAGSSATQTGGVAGANTMGISAATLAPGGSCTATVQVSSAASATYSNTTGAPTSANAGTGVAANASLNVTNLIPTVVTKAFAPANILVGGTSAMTITFSNTNGGANTITGVAFNDSYPLGLTNTAATPVSNTCGGTVTMPANGLQLAGGAIPVGGCSIVVNVTSSATGSYFNTIPVGGVTSTNAGVNAAAASQTLTVLAPPTITKSFFPAAIGTDAGDFSTMTIVVSNPNSVNLTGVNFTDSYPQDVGGVAAADMVNAPTPTLSNTCSPGSTAGTVTGGAAGNFVLGYSAATILPGGSCTISIRVRGGAVAAYSNVTGNVAATGPVALTGNSATAVLSVGGPGVTKSFSPATIPAGGTSLLTITLTNDNGSAITGVSFTDTYPGTLSNGGVASTTCGGTATTPTANSVALSGGTIPANGSCTVTVNVTSTTSPNVNIIPAGALTTSSGSNLTPATGTLLVTPPLTVAKSFTNSNVATGGTSVLTITLTNPNNFAVTGVGFTDAYPNSPAQLTNTGTPAGATTCSAGTVTAANLGTSVIFAGGTVPANSTCTVTVNVTAPAAGGYVNTLAAGAVTSGNAGANLAAATATLNVYAPPTISKSFTPASMVTGGTATLSLTATNPAANPGTLSAITLRDVFPVAPGAMTLANATVGNGCLSSTVTNHLGAALVAGAAGVQVSGISLPAGTSCTVTFNVTATALGTYSNTTDAITATGPVALTGLTANATLSVTAGVPVSGNIYFDANQNGVIDSGESWAGGTSVTVNLLQGTTVIASTTVNPGTGAYSFPAVAPGNYSLIVTTGAATNTPAPPAGWVFVLPTTGLALINVLSVPVTNINFGLFSGARITGRVFADTGVGSGIANDGVQNGTELGIGGVTVRLTDSGNTTLSTATTDAAGNYILSIPGTLPNGTVLNVVETNLTPYVSTGGSAGTTGGAYARATDATTFTLTIGTSYSGVNFADVPDNQFVTNGVASGTPGTSLTYSHTFTAGTAGSVVFSSTALPNPALAWSEVLYRDLNCNGILEPADPVISAAIPVVAGQIVCILVKEFVPATAPLSAQNQVTVSAAFAYANAVPALNTTYTRTDITTVGVASGLTLIKEVRNVTTAGAFGANNTALPGQQLEYRITYANVSSGALTNVQVTDTTPAFTTFVSAACGALVPNIASCSVTTQPAPGTTGNLVWTLTGPLAPGSQSTVLYTVTVLP